MICHHRLARLLAYKPSISHLLFILDDFTIPLLFFPSRIFHVFKAVQQDNEFQDTRLSHTHQHRQRHRHPHPHWHRHTFPSPTLRQSITTYPPLLPRSGQSLHHTTPRTTTPRRPLTALFVLGSPPTPQPLPYRAAGEAGVSTEEAISRAYLLAHLLAHSLCILALPFGRVFCSRRASLFARRELCEHLLL